MSPTHRPAENPAQPPHPATDAEPAPAPKWARSGTARPRKVIPLRPPPVPQLTSSIAPSVKPSVTPSAASPSGSAARVSGPDLLAQDAVFRQFLGATSGPVTGQPVQDPVGLALGMVARLIVAACAAAAVAMLLIGTFPLPSRVRAPVKSETAPLPAATADTAAGAERTATLNPNLDKSSDPSLAMVKGDTQAGGAAVGPAAAPPQVRVATVSVHARPAGAADRSALEPAEVARLVKRGEDSLAQGDIAAARLILGRAAEAQDARAALALGASFDPAVLRQLHVLGFRPDVAQARAWYEKAAEYGSAEASRRLAALPRLEQ